MLQKVKTQIKSMWKSLTHAVETNTDHNKLTLNRQIKDTPFTLQGNEDNGYFLCIGRYRITEPCNDPETAIEKLATEPWLIVSRMIASYIEFEKNIPEEIKNQIKTN